MSSSAATKTPVIRMRLIEAEDRYEGLGWTMARESGTTPNGNVFRMHWVLRNASGTAIDHDQYRHDLAERRELQLGR